MDKLTLERSHFFKVGDYAFMFEVAYYVLSPDYNLYMDKQQEINLRLAEALEREGIRFANPTQTVRLDGHSLDGLPVFAPQTSGAPG